MMGGALLLPVKRVALSREGEGLHPMLVDGKRDREPVEVTEQANHPGGIVKHEGTELVALDGHLLDSHLYLTIAIVEDDILLTAAKVAWRGHFVLSLVF